MTPNILVVGDLMVDQYIFGSSNRVSPEAPIVVVDVKSKENRLGGAGNVVNNLISLGSKVSIASVIGDDYDGDLLEQLLKDIDADLLIIKDKNRPTTKKSRIIALNQQIVRVDKESKEDISKDIQKGLLNKIESKIDKFDAIIISDYAKGVLTKDLTQQIIKLANRYNIPTFVDPKKDFEKYKGAFCITPNRKEAKDATSIEIIDDNTVLKAVKKLKEDLNLKSVVITLSEDGMVIFQNELTKIPTVAREVYDVTGAGDTVIASLAYFYSKSKDLIYSAKKANLAAGVVVGKSGSATVTLDEINSYEKRLSYLVDYKIKNFDEIESITKNTNKKVVFTNGCFDILHLGHVKYLQSAKKLGDILIVGVNSDRSVKKLKGDDRPINNQYDRAYLLASLECVDYVVIFDEDTPYELIKRVKPDILVKGADYKESEVVGRDIAKEVKLIEFIDGKSTTNIINRIRESK